jgi:hypothetical protein
MTYIIGEACIDVKDISCQSVCPVILPEDAIPEDWQPFVKINYAFNQGKPAVNELVEAYCDEKGIVADVAAE